MPRRETAEPKLVRGGRRKRDAPATQKRLLDAAEREFAERGYAGARLHTIAASASVQTTLIHHYFSDKQGLYRAVIERAVGPMQVDSWNLLREHQNFEALARGFVSMLMRFYAEHQHLLAIVRHELIAGSTVVRDILQERITPVASAAIAWMKELQHQGALLPDIDPTEIVIMTVSLAAYPFVEGPLLNVVVPGAVPADAAALQRREDAVVRTLMRAFLAKT